MDITQTWEDGVYYVTVGTGEGEYLSTRSKMREDGARYLQSKCSEL